MFPLFSFLALDYFLLDEMIIIGYYMLSCHVFKSFFMSGRGRGRGFRPKTATERKNPTPRPHNSSEPNNVSKQTIYRLTSGTTEIYSKLFGQKQEILVETPRQMPKVEKPTKNQFKIDAKKIIQN